MVRSGIGILAAGSVLGLLLSIALAQPPQQPEAVQAVPVPEQLEPEEAVDGEAEAVEAGAPPEQPSISAEELEGLVRELGSEGVEVRREASVRLSQRGDVRLRDLEGVLKREDLSLEQRRRLLAAAEQRFFGEPRAALGFTAVVGPHDGPPGVTIMRVEPGFPSSELLKGGDRIINVNGQDLPNFEAIRPIIVSRDPGDTLDLVIVRDGKNLEVSAELGSFERLSSHPDEGVLAAAWHRRSLPLRGDEAEPIASGLDVSLWAMPEFEHDVEEGASVRVVMGGEPRGGEWESSDADLRFMRGAGPGDVQDLRRQEQMRTQLALQLARINRELASPDLPRERRRELLQLRTSYEEALEQYDARLERLRRELAQPRREP